jgi:hypothetical protein
MRLVLSFKGETVKFLAAELPPAGAGFRDKVVKKATSMDILTDEKGNYEFRLYKGKEIIGSKPLISTPQGV